MTEEEARNILKGDPSGLEFMLKEVYKVCQKLIAITDFECSFYGTIEEVEWAYAFVYLVDHDEYYSKEVKNEISNNNKKFS